MELFLERSAVRGEHKAAVGEGEGLKNLEGGRGREVKVPFPPPSPPPPPQLFARLERERLQCRLT